MEERFNGAFLTLRVWGAYIYLEGPIHGAAYFRNFTVCANDARSDEKDSSDEGAADLTILNPFFLP